MILKTSEINSQPENVKRKQLKIILPQKSKATFCDNYDNNSGILHLPLKFWTMFCNGQAVLKNHRTPPDHLPPHPPPHKLSSRKVKLHLPKKAPKDTLPIPVTQGWERKWKDSFTENTEVMWKEY